MKEINYRTKCVIAGIQKLLRVMNKKYPYYTNTPDDYTMPEILYYHLTLFNGIGLDPDYYADNKEMVLDGLEAVETWCGAIREYLNERK